MVNIARNILPTHVGEVVGGDDLVAGEVLHILESFHIRRIPSMAIHNDVFLACTIGVVLINYSLWKPVFNSFISCKPWVLIKDSSVLGSQPQILLNFIKMQGDGLGP